VNALEPATNAGGGWQYSVSYRFEVVPRSGTEAFGGACSGQPSVDVSTNFYRYSLVFPDGSSHLLRMEGGAAGTPDGYYPHGPDGQHVCAVFNKNLPPLPLPLRFHTTDGTYVQVTRSANGWRAVFPDGRQVATDSTAWVAMARSICDRNANCVRISFEVDTDGTPLVHVIDDFDRRIRIKHLNTRPEYCADITWCWNSADEIYQSGYGDPPTDPANGASNRWTVTWGYSSIGNGTKGPLAYSCGSPTNDWRHSGQCTLGRYIRNVQQIELPTSTASSQRYQFCYADDNAPETVQGYGELISIGLPNGTSSAHSCATPSSFRPRVEYTYRYSRNRGRVAQVDSENAVLSKTLFRREVEPAGSDVSETWSYTYPETGRASGTITGPDGGTTTNEFYDPGVASGLRRLLKKTTSPLGATIEKIWAQNEPWIGVNAPLDRKNAYVQVEYRKPAGVAAESATAYELDKNGNVLSETVYDSGVSRGAGGFPSGSVLRKTAHTYSFPTPKASQALAGSSCGNDFGNAYWGCNQWLIYKQARSRTAVTGVSTGPESATEWSYDSPATTANVLEERRWDSTKEAALPASLNASNAEITSFTWSNRGNLLTTTTPDGDKTRIERGSSGC
jgi:YD repeat-containing protein